MKKKLILILFSYKFKSHYIERFNVNEFNKVKDVDVEIHQLIDFVFPSFKKAFQRNDTHKCLKIFKDINSWKKRIKFLKKKYKENVIIINTVQSISLNSFKINFFLKEKKIKILEFVYKLSLVSSLSRKIDFPRIRQFLNTLIFNRDKLYNFCTQNFFLNLKKILNIYPTYIMKIGKVSNQLINKEVKILEGNADDYNMYLSSKNNKGNIIKENYGLFLEAPTPLFEGDSFITKDDPKIYGEAKEWFEHLNKFFNFFEKNFKIKIKIAPHPKIDHKKKYPNFYYGREVLNAKLPDVARYSKFFISRFSTAMSFAVIYNKPAIFVTTNKIMNGPKYNFQKFYSSEYGTRPINIDKQFNLFDLKKDYKIDRKLYGRYKKEYLTVRNDNKKNYEIISKLF